MIYFILILLTGIDDMISIFSTSDLLIHANNILFIVYMFRIFCINTNNILYLYLLQYYIMVNYCCLRICGVWMIGFNPPPSPYTHTHTHTQIKWSLNIVITHLFYMNDGQCLLFVFK